MAVLAVVVVLAAVVNLTQEDFLIRKSHLIARWLLLLANPPALA